EQRTENSCVGGSIPSRATIFWKQANGLFFSLYGLAPQSAVASRFPLPLTLLNGLRNFSTMFNLGKVGEEENRFDNSVFSSHLLAAHIICMNGNTFVPLELRVN